MKLTPSQVFKKQLHDIIQNVTEEADVWKTCPNCKSFDESKEVCLKCFPPARPPARTIAFGCSAFEEVDSVDVPKKPVTQIPPNVAKFNDLGDDIPF